MKRAPRFFAKVENGDAHLLVYDEIGASMFSEGVSAKGVSDELSRMHDEGARNLHIYINSPGGDVFEGNTILNVISRWNGRKIVHIDGLAASMASVIAMVGDEIEIAPNGMVMIHEPWGIAVGNAEHMIERAALLEQLGENILDTYTRRTKQAREDVAGWMHDETWMDAKTAKERGFVDRIASDSLEDDDKDDDGLSWSMLDKFKKAPAEAARLLARASVARAHSAARSRVTPHSAATEEKQMPEKTDTTPVPAPAAAQSVTLTQEQFNALLQSAKPAPVVVGGAAAAIVEDAVRAPAIAKFQTPKALVGREERSDAAAKNDSERNALPLARIACAKAVSYTTGMPVADAAEYLGFRKTAEKIAQGAAMSIGDTAAGGSFVPVDVQNGFIDMLDEIPGRIASLIPAGNRYRSPLPVISIPTVTSGASGGWVAENPAVGNPEALATGTKTMTARKQRIEVVVSRDLLRSVGNIDQIVLNQMLRRSGQLDDIAIVEGTGADGQPTGWEVDVHTSAAMTASPDYENAHIDLLYMLKQLALHKTDLSMGAAFVMSTQHKYGLAGYMNPAGNAYPYADEMARGTLLGAAYRDSNLIGTDKVYGVAVAELLAFEQLAMLIESDSTYTTAAGLAASASSADQVVMRLWRKVDFSVKHVEAIVAKTSVTWGS